MGKATSRSQTNLDESVFPLSVHSCAELTSDEVDSVRVDVRWSLLGLCIVALCICSDEKQGSFLRRSSG